MMPRLISRKTMEAEFDLSEACVFRMTRTPGFPTPYRFGRTVRWDINEVAEWLTRQRDEATPDIPAAHLVAKPDGPRRRMFVEAS